MRRLSLLISLIISLLSFNVQGQTSDSDQPSATKRYAVYLGTEKAYFSGVCMMRDDGRSLTGAAFNEFGFSAFQFRYDKQKRKVKVLSITKPMDRWYIKRILQHDLAPLMTRIANGEDSIEYINPKYKITYRFNAFNDDSQE